MIICCPPDWCDPPIDLIICGPPEWCDHPSDLITWPMGLTSYHEAVREKSDARDLVAQIKQVDHATWAIAQHVFVGRKKGRNQILWKWYSKTSGQSPCLGSVRWKASILANCSTPTAATSQMVGGVFRFRLLQTRTWPSAPIPAATGRPQKNPHCGCDPREG